MVKQNAPLDDNNRAAVLATDPITGETRQVKTTPSGALATGLQEALSRSIDSVVAADAGWNWVKLTASGLVFTGACVFGGYCVLSSTGGAVTVYDNTAASGDTPTADVARAVAAGDQRLLTKPINMTLGAYISISGTATVYALVRAY